MNKTAVNKLLVEERKKMRLKAKESDFMKRSLSIYNGQVKRFEEHKSAQGKEFPFPLNQFRDWLKPFVDTICDCGTKMTIKGLAVDHRVPIARGGGFGLDNLQVLCKASNFRKGALMPDEFLELQKFVNERLSPESREDLWRRLTLGGKWNFR